MSTDKVTAASVFSRFTERDDTQAIELHLFLSTIFRQFGT